MTRPLLAGAMLILASCTSPDSAANKGKASPSPTSTEPIDARRFVGKPFSSLVAERKEFLVGKRAVSRAALGVYSEADGIEIPGQLREINGRDILVFFTCRMDRCSTASNVILVDVKNKTMEVASLTEGRFVVVVDGPPDLAEFARKYCKETICRTPETTTGPK